MTFTVTMLAMGTARAPDRSCSGCHTGVNTGPAQDLEPMNATWRAGLDADSALSRRPR